ncbi:beta-propeller fold lactonase family protein [Paracidovorax avenae]
MNPPDRPAGPLAEPGAGPALPTESFFAAVGDRLVRHALDAQGGMREIDRLAMPCGVQFACLDRERGLLYVACSNGGVGRPGDRHRLARVAVDGPMRLLEAPAALPYRPIHAALDPAGRRLLIAYNLPAALTVHPLDEAGRVGECLGPFEGEELVGWFPHQVLPMPGSDEVLLTCRGDDATAVRAENPGSLRRLRIGPQGGARPMQTVAPSGGFGFGPRNCAFHPAAPWLYAVLERQNALAVFFIRGGRIAAQPAHTVGMLQRPDRIHRPQLAGALALHPGGGFAYAVNRSHAVVQEGAHTVWAGGENSIVVFRLDTRTGEAAPVQCQPLQGLHARCIALAHGGRLLVAAIRQASAQRTPEGIRHCPAGFSTFRIGQDGCLQPLGHHAVEVGAEQIFWAGCSEGLPCSV